MSISTYRTIIVLIGLVLCIVGAVLIFLNLENVGNIFMSMSVGFSVSLLISYSIKYYEE